MAFIEGAPLRGIGIELAAIGRKVIKSEFEDSPLQALADLTAHFAKAGPAQAALRQCPLEKGRAIAIVHRTADYARLRVARSVSGRGPAVQ